MVTSKAVVGSSAINNLGLQDKAMAIITRCRMPPEHIWGYFFIMLSASRMPVRLSSRTLSAQACSLV